MPYLRGFWALFDDIWGYLGSDKGYLVFLEMEMGNENYFEKAIILDLFELEIGLFVRKDGLFSSLMQKVADN